MDKKKFLYTLSVAAFLIGSWLFPLTRPIWNTIDIYVFRYLNNALLGRELWQFFWAIANVRITDIFGAFFMFVYFWLAACSHKEYTPATRLAQFLFICFWGEIGIFTSKQILYPFMVYMHILRKSPTVVLENCIRLSQAIPWLHVKDASEVSFPGDHALIVLQWAIFISFFYGKRFGFFAFIASIFFILPRLISGAHWFTDVVVGSLSYVLIIFAFSCYSQLHTILFPFFKNIAKKICIVCKIESST